jgi:hypothetical protein
VSYLDRLTQDSFSGARVALCKGRSPSLGDADPLNSQHSTNGTLLSNVDYFIVVCGLNH